MLPGGCCPAPECPDPTYQARWCLERSSPWPGEFSGEPGSRPTALLGAGLTRPRLAAAPVRALRPLQAPWDSSAISQLPAAPSGPSRAHPALRAARGSPSHPAGGHGHGGHSHRGLWPSRDTATRAHRHRGHGHRGCSCEGPRSPQGTAILGHGHGGTEPSERTASGGQRHQVQQPSGHRGRC